MSKTNYQPKPEHKFSFGLWTLGNRGRDPFGDAVRRTMPPDEIASVLGEIGAWGVNLHDNDLVPIDATPAERDRIVREFRKACQQAGIVVPMATVNLVFSSRVSRRRVYRQRSRSARLCAAENHARHGPRRGVWARRFLFCGAAAKASRPMPAAAPTTPSNACAKPSIIFASTTSPSGYKYRFALEAKPNEPRGDIYMATTGHYLGFIPTLDHPEMVGVNPEVAHEQMAGLNFMHGVAQAWEAGKLFHIDLNDQVPGRYDQDLRFGSANPKSAFWLVKFLEDVGYNGPRHFDAHAYRTEDYDGVKDFARGCMRTYLILRKRPRAGTRDEEIQAILKEISTEVSGTPKAARYSDKGSAALLSHVFDKDGMMKKAPALRKAGPANDRHSARS